MQEACKSGNSNLCMQKSVMMRPLHLLFPLQSVPLSVEKHKQLMTGVLSDPRLTELQRRGGAWLAGLANETSRLAHRSPDCR